MVISNLQSRKYDESFEYFKIIYEEKKNEFYGNDCNLYLYLFNLITDIPEKYQKKAKLINFLDIKINENDNRFKDRNIENTIRTNILRQNFYNALKIIDEIESEKDRLTIREIITKTLLVKALEQQLVMKKTIIALIKEKKYDEIIKYISNIESKHSIKNAESIILQLTKDLKNIKETGNIPEKTNCTTNLFDVIEHRNYELAFSLCNNYNENKNLNAETNPIYMLLKEIIKTINNIKEKKIELTDKVNPPINFSSITQYLLNQDLDNAFITLKSYLENINKMEYEFLISNLIKISVLEKDISVSKPMAVLTHILSDDFKFDISDYIQKFYISLSQNNFECARTYLDIILKSNNLIEQQISIEGLKEVLNITENSYNSNKVVEKPKEQVIIKEIKPNNIEKSKEIQLGKCKDYDDNKFIKGKIPEIQKKGIVLLRPMDKARRKEIHNIVKNIPGISSFSIGSDEKQIVIKNVPFAYEKIDASKIAKEGNQCYIEGDYDSCIEKYKQLLRLKNNKYWVYAKIGLSYMRKYDKNTAISYLTIANELGKEEQDAIDYTELIDNLKGIVNPEETKPKIEMSEVDFDNDINNYYGIECINELSNLIVNGVSLDEACINMNLNEEQKNIVLLIVAKECYETEKYELGDQYIKKVEKTKNRGRYINNLINEIRKNKKFYKNRMDSKENKLVLIPKTKK